MTKLQELKAAWADAAYDAAYSAEAALYAAEVAYQAELKKTKEQTHE